MSLESLADAFYEELRDVLSAERQLLKALPKMEQKANSEELKQAISNHLAETEQQVKRVEAAFEDTGRAVRAKTCKAMEGLIKEAEETLGENAEPETMDALIIACAQKVEHYEIATYGTLCTWAEILEYNNALELLKQNMGEEEEADEKLTSIAGQINFQAAGEASE